MALDKVLKIYDEQGNPVDYDILAKDVKFQPDGKDLPTKLAEMEQEIEDAAGGGYAPPAGGIPKSDLASGVQSSLDKADTALQQSDKTELQNEINNKVDKVTGKGLSTNDYTDTEKTKLAGIAAGAQVNVINGIKAHGASTNLPVTNGVVELPEQTEVDLDDYYDKDEVDAAIANKLSNVIVNNIPAGSVAIIDDTTTGGSDKVLSAEQGKVLAEEIDDIPVIDIRMVGSKLVINTNASLSARITIGALSSDSLSCRGGQTATSTFQVSGRRLTGNIGISLSDNTNFSISSNTIQPSGGVAQETLTVTYHPASGATAGTTHSCVITITSGGTTYGTLELTGTVAAAPSITLAPATQTISTESGQSATGTINVKGNALDGDITLAISGSGFSLSTNSVSKAEAESANGKDITVTFDGSADDAHATITAYSTGATDATAEVTGDIAQRLNAGDTFDDNDFTYTVLTDTTKVGIKGRRGNESTLQGAITLPSSATYNGLSYEVAEISAQGFINFNKITSLTLPSSIKTVGSIAFYGTTVLNHLDLGEVETFQIGGYNFFSGTGLEEITIPYTIKAIRNILRANFTTIILGDAVHGFGSNATDIAQILQHAGSTTDDNTANTLTKVICYAAHPFTIGTSTTSYIPNGMALADNGNGTTLYVPAASKSEYEADTHWSKFPHISTIESLNQ